VGASCNVVRPGDDETGLDPASVSSELRCSANDASINESNEGRSKTLGHTIGRSRAASIQVYIV